MKNTRKIFPKTIDKLESASNDEVEKLASFISDLYKQRLEESKREEKLLMDELFAATNGKTITMTSNLF